jgi:NAD+ kinase
MPPFTYGDSNLLDAAGSVDPGSSATRRGSRPQNLLLDHSKTASGAGSPNIQIVRSSPLANQFSQSIPDISEQTVHKPFQTSMSISEQALKSPCFVHSQLEKGVSLTDWLRHSQLNDRSGGMNLKSGGSSISEFDSPSTTVNDEEDDEQFNRSLTRQLAETAVGVREMSKALGEWPIFVITPETLNIPVKAVHAYIQILIVFSSSPKREIIVS